MTPTPYSERDDWFVVGDSAAKELAACPGLQRDERRQLWIVHRNLLPLLDVELVQGKGLPALFGDGVTTLRPHQEVGRDFICSRRGSLVADSMRLGKTAEITASHDPWSGPMIVVGPLAVRNVWREWFGRRFPGEDVAVLTGRNFDPDFANRAPLVFCHYDVLSSWVSAGLGRRIGTIVFDEGHALSNRKSKRSQAAVMMSPQAERIILASGTPLWNATQGLYNLLTIVNPGGWGTYSEFTIRYCDAKPGAYGWVCGEPSNIEELQTRLREVMIARNWRDISDDVPATNRHLEEVEIDSETERELDLICRTLAADTGADQKTVVGELARYRKIVGKFKTPRAVDLALNTEGPVVVWTWHKDVARAIELRCPSNRPIWSITGKVPEAKREDILDEWRRSDDGILVMSLAIGQAGIDLSHSATCIFAELDWTPAVIGQAEMRTFSPTRPSDVTYIVARHELDEKLARVLAEKSERAKLLGIPASDTATDVIGRIFGVESEELFEVDLDALAARIAAKVMQEGTTFV